MTDVEGSAPELGDDGAAHHFWAWLAGRPGRAAERDWGPAELAELVAAFDRDRTP